MDSNVRTGSSPVRGTSRGGICHPFFVCDMIQCESNWHKRFVILLFKMQLAMKRSKEDFIDAAKNALSLAGMCRNLGLKPCGGNYKLMHNAIQEYAIDISHFTGQGWNRNLVFKPFVEKPLQEILVSGSTYQSYKLKNRLLKEGIKQHVCEHCGRSVWCDKKIPLELHHINGDNRDNRLDNLLILCPNCHALTETYRGKNKSK